MENRERKKSISPFLVGILVIPGIGKCFPIPVMSINCSQCSFHEDLFMQVLEAMKCAYIILVMAGYWMTEALPLPITSMIPMVRNQLFGVVHHDFPSLHKGNQLFIKIVI